MQGLIKRDQSEMANPSFLNPEHYDYDVLQNLFYPEFVKRSRSSRNKSKQRKLAEKYYASIFKRGWPRKLFEKISKV